MLKTTTPFLLLLLIGVTACDLGEKVDEAIVTVSGNVSDGGQPVPAALVMLVDSPDSSDGLSLANGSITSSTGNYTILNVDPGTYYVMAVDDANDNLKFDIATDKIGFFGIDPAGNDLTPDGIEVTDDDLENIDIEYLYSLEEATEGTQVTTPNIKLEPYYFSFDTGDAVSEIHDVTLKLESQSYIVALNASANISAVVKTSGDFDTAEYSYTDTAKFDGAEYVIGDNWMDVSTYNPTDHSISNNGTFYFVRAAGYQIVKFMVDSASPSVFNIKYAVSADGGTTFPAATEQAVSYSEESPVDFDFSQGMAVTPAEWHVGLITSPVASAPYPMQNVIINYENNTQVAVISDQSFDELESVPVNVSWLTADSQTRPLAYSGDHEVLTYNPADHTVSIVNPELVYIVNIPDGSFYKLRFINYEQSAGIIEFEYAALWEISVHRI